MSRLVSSWKMSSARFAPAPPAGRDPVQSGAADEDRVGAEHQRLQHIAAAPETASTISAIPAADRAPRLGKNVDRCDRPVELAPAMVRDRHCIGADLGGALDIAHRQQPLDDQLARPAVADLLDRIPGTGGDPSASGSMRARQQPVMLPRHEPGHVLEARQTVRQDALVSASADTQ